MLASAQDAATPAADSGALEEVIVTALKRTSDLQQTPIAIDVISGDMLSRAGVNNIAAIANIAPSLNFGGANGVYTTVTIRGVSSQDTTELGDPAVGFNIDGEYINRPLNLAATLFDVDRIEVLRGPQGTLYGRNATAGAINILTRKPSDQFEAYISAEAGDYSLFGGEGAVNVPIADNVAVRIAGVYTTHDGYTEHELDRETDDSDIKAGRVRLLINRGALTVLLTGEIIETDGAGPSTKGILVSGPARTLPSDLRVAVGDRDTYPIGMDPHLKTQQRDIRGEISYDFSFATLTYVGGYRTTELDQFQNIQGTPVHVSDFDGNAEYDTLGNELRLGGETNGGIAWQVGYYNFLEDQSVDSRVYQRVTAQYAPRDTVYRLNFVYPEVEAKSNAFFGETTFPLTDRLSFTTGIRYTDDEKSRTGTQYTLDLATFNATQGGTVRYIPTDVGGETASTRTNWNAVFNFQVTPDNLLYVKGSTGYKSGGFTTVNEYGPEDLLAYEIGSKNRWLDGSLQFNASAFYYDYQDQQISTFIVTPSGVTAASTQNAASSTEYGLELDATWLITPDDRLRVTADYLHAEFDEFNAAVTSFSGATIPADLTGNEQPFAPEWTLSLSFDHTFRATWGSINVGVISAYKSDYYLSATNFLSEQQSSYTKTDFTLGYKSPSERYDVTAYVRNIEDERTFRQANFASSAGADFFRYQFSDPRTFGVKATVRFE